MVTCNNTNFSLKSFGFLLAFGFIHLKNIGLASLIRFIKTSREFLEKNNYSRLRDKQ
jgi:hypothetical protein